MALYPGRNDDAVECAIDMFQACVNLTAKEELGVIDWYRHQWIIDVGAGIEDRMEASVISNSVNLSPYRRINKNIQSTLYPRWA